MYSAFQRQLAQEAKDARDAAGVVNAELDAQYDRIMGATDVRATVHAAAGGFRPDGPQGEKPENVARMDRGTMVGERPASGGRGDYGTRKTALSARLASEKQITWIEGMLRELDTLRPDDGARQAVYAVMRDAGRLTGGYNGTASQMITSLKAEIAKARAATGGVPCASPAQQKLINDLLSQLDQDHAKAFRAGLAACRNGRQVSQMISGMIAAARALPTAQRPARAPLETVEDGYYAVTGDDGALKFYRVKNHRNGRVYVNVRASDSWHDVQFRAYAAILGKIAQDPHAAGMAYARKLGNCYRCDRTLTDDESRARGIGPVCATK